METLLKRRQFCLAPLAAAAAAAKWDPERLGVFCNLGTVERTARETLAAARNAGFRRVQVFFPWARVDSAFLKAVPEWAGSADVRVEVLSAYVNCCQPELPIMECRAGDFERAIDMAAGFGARHLIAWTGGYTAGLMKAEPRNFAPEAADSIVRFLERYTGKLERAGLRLALEQYHTLACPDAPSLRRMLDRLPKCVGAVMDPPNLTPVSRYAGRDGEMRAMFAMLRGRVAVVHLKDFRMAPGGTAYELPGPMRGEMNYRLFAGQVLSLPASTPIVAEHLKPEEFAEARRGLLELFGRAAA